MSDVHHPSGRFSIGDTVTIRDVCGKWCVVGWYRKRLYVVKRNNPRDVRCPLVSECRPLVQPIRGET